MAVDEGLGGVVRAAVAGAAATVAGIHGDQGEQLDMLAERLALLPTRLVDEKAAEARTKVSRQMGAGGRGPGRPQGAENLSTRQFRAYMLRLYGSPLEWLARWSIHTPETLAAELGCTKLEAFDRLRMLKSELAPYFHGRVQPTDEQGRAVPFLQLVLGDGTVVGGPGQAPWMDDPEVRRQIEGEVTEAQQNQALSDAGAAKSHGESRTDDASA